MLNWAPILLAISLGQEAPAPEDDKPAEADKAVEADGNSDDSEEAKPKPNPKPKRKPPASAAARADAAPKLKLEGDRANAAAVAIKFFDAMLAERVDDVVALSKPTFSFDGRTTASVEDLRQRWEDIFARREGSAYRVYDIEVLTTAEAIAKYGKAPKRLAIPGGAYVAIANISGRATIALLQKNGGRFQVIGLHD